MSEENITGLMMPKGDELILSSSPHIHDKRSVPKIMLIVILSLVPALLFSVWFFGFLAFKVILITTVSAFVAEALWLLIAKAPLRPLTDLSAVLTGLLLAMNLPSSTPWWVCILGGFLAIWVGKQVFGGIGHNLFNPALVARVALLIALPAMMTTWYPTLPMAKENSDVVVHESSATKKSTPPQFISCATPLGEVSALKTANPEGEDIFASITTSKDYYNYFIGNKAGSLGETSCLALLLGGIMLVCFKLIKWQVPVVFIGTVAIFTGLVHFFAPTITPPATFHILTGGLFLGAIFMATDMVTTPITTLGCIIFAFGCGVITSVIRIWGSYPEGVSFAILLMNSVVPLIDRYCHTRPFGYAPKRAEVAK